MPKIGINFLENEEISFLEGNDRISSVFHLEGEILDGQTFYQAARKCLPQDPLLLSDKLKWDALADSLWGGIFNLEKSSVLIIWRKYLKMKENDKRSYIIACEILESMAATLNDPKYCAGRTTQLFILTSPT